MEEINEHPFYKCVDEKRKFLEEKHSKFLKGNNITLENAIIITFEYSQNGITGFSRITDYNPEINKDIEDALNNCAEKHLIKK